MTVHALHINGPRLNATIQDTNKWGSAHRYGPGQFETGMNRLSLNDDDAAVRQWLVNELKSLGCTVTVDQIGNMQVDPQGVKPDISFGIRAGRRSGAPTAMGSHLDTQPTGGRYDGILGVHAGLEVLRTLNDNGITTEYPLAVVNWTNEEGARFPKITCGSGVWAGQIPLEEAWALQDVAGPATMKSELERIGFLGNMKSSYECVPLGAHFELHIEQGPILERNNKRVGVVGGVQGFRWFQCAVTGREAHAGSTPLEARSDALLCSAKIMVAVNEAVKKHGGVATTGIIHASPGAVNTIPGHVSFTIDLRHPSDDALIVIEREFKERADSIAKNDSEQGCTVEWQTTRDQPAVTFDPAAVACVRSAASAVVGSHDMMDIQSGAGHDSCSTSLHCPTAMVFVPSKDGVSHAPVEYTSPEECTAGGEVLLQAVLNWDSQRNS